MKDFSQLKKNLKREFSNLKLLKLAILGDTATQFLTQALRGMGFDSGFNLEIWEADFNQIERQVYDLSSEFYEFKPEIVIVFQSSHKLLGKYNKIKPSTTVETRPPTPKITARTSHTSATTRSHVLAHLPPD